MSLIVFLRCYFTTMKAIIDFSNFVAYLNISVYLESYANMFLLSFLLFLYDFQLICHFPLYVLYSFIPILNLLSSTFDSSLIPYIVIILIICQCLIFFYLSFVSPVSYLWFVIKMAFALPHSTYWDSSLIFLVFVLFSLFYFALLHPLVRLLDIEYSM